MGGIGSAISNGAGNAAKAVGGLPLALISGTGGGGNGGYQSQYFAQPDRPDWSSNLDPGTGLLKNSLQSQFNPDSSGMNAYKDFALGTGPSPWASAQLQNQGLQEQGLKNSTQNQNASANAQAESSLASKYGLSQGARERLATQSQRNNMMGLQNVGFQGAQARAGIGAQDAQNRQGFLANLPGLQNQQAGMQTANQQYNIGNAINETNAKRANDLNTYNQQMQAWAANKSGDAMRQSGSGGKK